MGTMTTKIIYKNPNDIRSDASLEEYPIAKSEEYFVVEDPSKLEKSVKNVEFSAIASTEWLPGEVQSSKKEISDQKAQPKHVDEPYSKAN